MREPEPMVIAVRAYAEPITREAERDARTSGTKQHRVRALPRPSDYALIFDTETTTDEFQSLRIGAYQVRKSGELIEHGLFCDPMMLSIAEVKALAAYARSVGARFRDREDFLREVFYPYAYHKGALLIGFNLPFDLSRLAISIRASQGHDMRNGFTMKLLREKWNPPVLVKHLNSRTSFIRFAAAGVARDSRGASKRGQRTPARRGYFQDVRTLAGALLGRSVNLASLAKALGTEHTKQEVEGHGGPLTPEYLAYAMTDVQVTWECYEALAKRYGGHGIRQTPSHRIYSEASLGKAYLKEMEIQPPAKTPTSLTPELLGIIMATYYGGRAEVRIRRDVVRVLYCDFRSMYPTVCSLMGLWQFVISRDVCSRDATDEAREILATATPDSLHDGAFWRRLPILVQVKPDADAFPVRATYGGTSRTIGLNYLTGDAPGWYTLADCIASKLLTGKAPAVIRAIGFAPVGVQPGLKPIQIGGRPEYTIDPARDDFYRRVIELRATIRREMRAAGKQSDNARAEELDGNQMMLKLMANATSYGIFAELNVQTYDTAKPLTCYGIDGEPFQARSRSVEEPGSFFHPLIATLITGAARLMLATAERLASDHGLGWAFCDTDSLAIARPEGMDDPTFIHQASAIVRWFDGLNPYGDDEPLFKIEDENFRLVDGQPDKTAVEPLYAYAISAKRYALFNIGPESQPVIRKALAHGLGHLIDPYSEADAPAEIPTPVSDLRKMGIRRWHHDLWYLIVSAALAGEHDMVDLSFVPNMQTPAASRYSLTTPVLAHWFDRFNEAHADRGWVRAFNFMLSFQLSIAKVNLAIAEGRLGADIKKDLPAPVAPYNDDIAVAAWSCFDRKTGEPAPLELLATYAEALAGYHLHSEAKFANGEAFDRGVTERRHVCAIAVEYIGKEANRWEEQFHVGEMPEAQIEYGVSDEGKRALLALVGRCAGRVGLSAIAVAAGMSRQQVAAILNGKAMPRSRNVRALATVIGRHDLT